MKTAGVILSRGYTPVCPIINVGKKGKQSESFTCVFTLLILMAQGAPGNPGRQVLNADISEKAPRPQALIPATRNL